MLCVVFVSLSIIVGSSVGRPDGVKGCGTPEASFVPIHGNSSHNESLPVYIRALRNDTDWSVLIWTEGISYKGFYLRVFSNTFEETARGTFVEVPPKSRACSSVGEDEVMTCKVYGSGVNFEMGFNTAGQKSYQKSYEWYSNDLIVQDNSLVEGVCKCVIDRKIESDGLLQLSKKWYLLHAIGVVSENSLQYHKERSVSGEKVDLQSNVVVVEEPPSRLLLILHGVFMVLAWMFFAPVGIFTAKFFRTNKAICGQKLWFQVNITVDYRNIHPVIGITTLCLCVGNALVSLCRCAPEEKRRIIFNRVHRLCGLISCILAGVNIALGTRLERSMLPMGASYLVYAYLGLLLLIEVVHQVLKCRRDLQDTDAKATSSKGNQHKMERTLLLMATLVCLTLSSLVVYFLILTQ
uniref:ascorbate ferrireductase (transmembrane) n=1 Tax=Crassostrea virginica TaxID=6565 RepID=A0A8B8AUB5_CRAVI|nr:putative ferric-chelate reductase 1 homolog [Crassostrea virginica]